jgi:hypothetical protein
MIDADMHGDMPDAHTPVCTCARICTHAGDSCSQTHAQDFDMRWEPVFKIFCAPACFVFFIYSHNLLAYMIVHAHTQGDGFRHEFRERLRNSLPQHSGMPVPIWDALATHTRIY